MKVVFILKYFLPAQTAGTEVYVAALASEFLKLGLDVAVIKPGIGHNTFNQYFYEGIRVIEYPESEFIDKDLKTGKRKPAGLVGFKELLYLEKPDIVHFHEISGSNGITIDHVKIARELAIPVYITLHLIGYTCQTGTLMYKGRVACDGVVKADKCSVCTLHKKGFRYGSAEFLSVVGGWFDMEKWPASMIPGKLSGALSYPGYSERHLALLHDIFSLADRVFILSNWFKEVLLRNGIEKNKMILLSKAVPTNSPRFDDRSVKHKENEIVKFVYLGRISRVKGLVTILLALKKVKLSNWSFDIYGQSTEPSYLLECEQLAKEIKGTISWRGILKPTEVVTTLRQYDALIFPTVIQEMVGLVVQEAFAARIPVIGSNVKGIAEQVTDKVDGLLFDAGNADSLQRELSKVLSNKQLLPQLAANIKPPRLFKDVAEQTLKVYETAVKVNGITLKTP